MKRIIVCILVAVLGCSLLVGCGSREDEMKHISGSGSSKVEHHYTDELTIFALYRNKDLEWLAKAYEALHPEVKVTIDYGKSEGTDLTKTEILKNMNTALLNGNGPDIICFDGFSAGAYEDYLVDVSDIVEKHKEDCYTNILSAYEEDDQILQIPLRFALTVIGSGQVDYDNMNSIAEYQKELEKTDGTFNEEFFPNMIALWCRTYAAHIENSGKVSEVSVKEFYQFLDVIKEKSGTAYLHDEINYGIDVVLIDGVERKEHEPYEREKMDLTYQFFSTYFGIRQYLTSYKQDAWEIYPIKLDDATYFMAEAVLGINNTSEDVELARDFIDYALTVDGQDACNYFSIPVNREKIAGIQQDNTSFIGTGTYVMNDKGREEYWEAEKVTEEMAEHYDEILESVDTPICYNTMMIRFLVEPYVDYVDGKLTLDEAVDTAVEKINLYQMEKQ